jgi:transcriptional regulator with XRE-family HTH domain
VSHDGEIAEARLTLGRRLAALRKASGLGQREFADKVAYSRSTVANVEVGRQHVGRDFWARSDDVLSAGGALVSGHDAVEKAAKKRDLASAHAAEAARRAEVTRWQAEHRAPTAGMSALASVRIDDLKHMVTALDNARRHPDEGVSFERFRNQIAECASDDGSYGPKGALPAVLGIIGAIQDTARREASLARELLAIGAQGAEFAGWLYRDAGVPEMASYWRDRAMEWAQVAGDGPMQGYVLLKKSQAAWDERDALRMLTLARAAQEGPWHLPPKVRAEAIQQDARGHAMLSGKMDLAERKLDEAQELLAGGNDESARMRLGSHYNTSLLATTATSGRSWGRLSRRPANPMRQPGPASRRWP